MDFSRATRGEENDEKLVYDFPYQNLREVSPADLEFVR